MEGLAATNANTTAFLIFLFILSALGIVWTVFCSWLTGRKKRQRVANNSHGEELALRVETPLSRTKGKSSDRYSAVEQVITPPIDDLGRSLRLPTIVVTPPSPQETPLEETSLPSDSSIGAADDLIRDNQICGDDVGEANEAGVVSEICEVGGKNSAPGAIPNILDCEPVNDEEKRTPPEGIYSPEDETLPNKLP